MAELECGHEDTMSHLIVNMGSALLIMLPVLNNVTLKAWQDVFIPEVVLILEAHGLKDKPGVDITGDAAMADRITEAMTQAIKAHIATPKVTQSFIIDGPMEEI